MEQRARDRLMKYLEDMHALLVHGDKAITRQLDEDNIKGDATLAATLRGFVTSLERQQAAIEARLKELGSSPASAVQDAATGVAGLVAGLYNRLRSEPASKSLRDDYTYVSHCAVAYMLLHATSAGLGDAETARLADQGYREAARMVMEIDRILPDLVLRELRQDGLPVQDVADGTRRLISEAWNQSAPSELQPGATTG